MYSLDKIFRFKKKRISSFLCDRLCRLKVTASVSVESGTRRPFSNLLLFNENFSMARLSAMLYTWLIIHVRDRFVSVSSFLLIYACVSVCRCVFVVILYLFCLQRSADESDSYLNRWNLHETTSPFVRLARLDTTFRLLSDLKTKLYSPGHESKYKR
jgi:hypothetical protein